MSEVVRFRGVVSWEQFKRAQWKHMGRRWLVLLTYPAAMMAWAFSTGAVRPAATWILLIITTSAFVPAMLAFNLFAWRRTYVKSPYLHKPLFGSVSSDRFEMEGATGRSDLTWDQFVRVREGKGFLLLYPAPNLYFILPREFFECDTDWETARRYARRASTT